MFSQFLKAFGANNTINFDAFGASQATMFSVLGGKKTCKNHSIYSFFWTAPSKNTGIYAVFIMLQDMIFHAKITKNHVNYSALGLLVGFEGGVLKYTAIS